MSFTRWAWFQPCSFREFRLVHPVGRWLGWGHERRRCLHTTDAGLVLVRLRAPQARGSREFFDPLSIFLLVPSSIQFQWCNFAVTCYLLHPLFDPLATSPCGPLGRFGFPNYIIRQFLFNLIAVPSHRATDTLPDHAARAHERCLFRS